MLIVRQNQSGQALGVRMRLTAIRAIGCAFLVHVAALSAETTWTLLGESASSPVKVYADLSSLTRSKQFGTTSIWAKYEYGEDDRQSRTHTVDLHEFRCGERLMRSAASTTYFKGSAKNRSRKREPDWDHIVPQSLAEAVYEAACPPKRMKGSPSS